MKDWKKGLYLLFVFLVAYYLPLGNPVVSNSIMEAFKLLQWYAINHTLACVVPAMFIAGAIQTFLSQASVMQYLGPSASKIIAYGVASVSGVVLAVCSCSVLPMFAGIYAMGAGLGPASAFLYSGPAINVMAIFLSARVLGFDLGVARALGAIIFSIFVGLAMALIFKKSDTKRLEMAKLPPSSKSRRKLWQTALYFLCMILFLVFSDWYDTNEATIITNGGKEIHAVIRYNTRDAIEFQQFLPDGKLSTEIQKVNKNEIVEIQKSENFTQKVHSIKWYLAGIMGIAVLFMVLRWFTREEVKQWMIATWDFGLMIIPLLFIGVFITGFVGGLLPEKVVGTLVGGNSLKSNFIASFIGMLWYFATLTEIPIVEMLMRLGMGKGPALALLLAGPALSLPSILVINRVIGAKKTLMFCFLVVALSTLAGLLFGIIR